MALRCDIDALPVQEETGLPYTSENPGIMHACGHDMHASMMLGAAKILCGMRERFAGCVKLIFQHSEDTLPGGAKELVEKGVLENPMWTRSMECMCCRTPTGQDRLGSTSGP